MLAQPSLLDSIQEADSYHSRGPGYFTLNQRHPGNSRMVQTPYRLDDLYTVLRLLDPSIDTWISQGEFFRKNRRVINLARIGLFFVDLDYYRIPSFEYCSPEHMTAVVLGYLEQEDLPPPTIIVSSGQGLQLKWVFEYPLISQALPRWNACQATLVNTLKAYGADPRAKDASRILRAVGTVNSKSGELARVVHYDPDAIASFDYLAEILLPYTREQIESFRQEAHKRRKLRVLEGGKKGPAGFSGRQLAWDRLKDLQHLTRMRGGMPEGLRMHTLFYSLNFLLLSGATNPNQMWHEARALAYQIDPDWVYRPEELSTLYRKAQAHLNGETITFRGRKYSPLYTPKNSTLIDQLEITDDEQKQLRTIISKDLAQARRRERDRERDEKRRREAGAIDRATYEANSKSRTKPWDAMGMSRSTWYRLGQPLPSEVETGPSPTTNGGALARG